MCVCSHVLSASFCGIQKWPMPGRVSASEGKHWSYAGRDEEGQVFICVSWMVCRKGTRFAKDTPYDPHALQSKEHTKTCKDIWNPSIHPSIYLSINKEPNQQILQHRLQPVSNMFLFVSLTPGTWDLLWRAAGGHQPVARAPSTAGLRHFVNLRHMTVILWLHIVSICFDRLWRTHCFKELKMASSWCSELGECAVAVGAPGQDRNHLYPDD